MNPPENNPNSASEQAADEVLTGTIPMDSTESPLEKLQAELREANDRALRSHAELENYRKRVRREMEDDRRYAALPMATDLLAVVDNLQRAMDAAALAKDSGGLLDGVKMVAAQLNMVLQNHHCKPIETVGTTFDPHLHQAIAQEPSTEFAAGIVTRSAQVGYKLHERVVRPAQVFVSTGAPTA